MFSIKKKMENQNIQFIVPDDREAVLQNLCDRVSTNMDATGLRLPPAWTSVRELAEHVWHVNDAPQVKIEHLIYLRNELAREDYQNSWIGQDID